jgi:hypothetical protein
LHYTVSKAKGSNAPNTINNVITNMKRQPSIITIPEWGMPWLASGTQGGKGALAGWADKKLPRVLLGQNQFPFAGAAQGIAHTVMADKQFIGIGKELPAIDFGLLATIHATCGGRGFAGNVR